MSDFERYRDYSSTFNENYEKAYQFLESQIQDYLRQQNASITVLDVGCGDGWMAEILGAHSGHEVQYLGVDPAANPIQRLEQKSIANVKIQCLKIQAQDLLSFSGVEELRNAYQRLTGKNEQPEFDLVLCNATGHQIRKNHLDQNGEPREVREVYDNLASYLAPNGTIIISDYYYPSSVSDDQEEHSQFWIRSMTGQQPTHRNGFIAPAIVRNGLISEGLEIISEPEAVRSNDHIHLYYYSISARKQN